LTGEHVEEERQKQLMMFEELPEFNDIKPEDFVWSARVKH
jgi:hypothetical protein